MLGVFMTNKIQSNNFYVHSIAVLNPTLQYMIKVDNMHDLTIMFNV